jgi:hypothetical protein
MSYVIDGPVDLGSITTATNIHGNVTLVDAGGTAGGTIYYANNLGFVTALAPVTNGVLIGGLIPSYVTGTNSQVLSIVGGVPTFTAAPLGVDSGFSATKVAGDSFTTTPSIVGNWTTATTSSFDTSSGAWNSTTGIFTVGTAAKYILDVYIAYSNTGAQATSGDRTIEVYDNNAATVIRTLTTQPNASSSIAGYMPISSAFDFTVGQQICVRFYRSTAGTTNTIDANSFFSIVRYS